MQTAVLVSVPLMSMKDVPARAYATANLVIVTLMAVMESIIRQVEQAFAPMVTIEAVLARVSVGIMMVIARVGVAMVQLLACVKVGFTKAVLVVQHAVISSASLVINTDAMVLTSQLWDWAFAQGHTAAVSAYMCAPMLTSGAATQTAMALMVCVVRGNTMGAFVTNIKNVDFE